MNLLNEMPTTRTPRTSLGAIRAHMPRTFRRLVATHAGTYHTGDVGTLVQTRVGRGASPDTWAVTSREATLRMFIDGPVFVDAASSVRRVAVGISERGEVAWAAFPAHAGYHHHYIHDDYVLVV